MMQPERSFVFVRFEYLAITLGPDGIEHEFDIFLPLSPFFYHSF